VSQKGRNLKEATINRVLMTTTLPSSTSSGGGASIGKTKQCRELSQRDKK